MSEWIETILKDIADVQTGPFGSQLKNEQYIKGGTPVVTVEHISDFKIADFDYPSVTDEDLQRLKKYTLNAGDIVFTRVGSVDLSAYIKPHQSGWMFSSRMLRVRPHKNIDSHFLAYYFQQKAFREYILSIAVGATMPSINTEILKGLPVSFPPLPEQEAIGGVLSSLDDKIDLLHRQNITLEAMAEALFRQWFVEEAQEDWEEVKLGDVFDVGIGRTPPRKESKWFTIDPNDIKWISIRDIGNGGVYINNTSEYITQQAVETFNIPVIPENTVILSFKLTMGRVAITTEKMLSNEAIAHFKIKEDSNFYSEYLYLFLKSFNFDSLGSTSSIATAVNSKMIKEIEMPSPDKEKLLAFKKIAETQFSKIKENISQIRTLTQLRDTLLPKLMSGEVRVRM